MTDAEREALIDKMAAEICYAWFLPPIDYGGPEVYWRGVVLKKKEAYRREARAALAVAEPAIRKDALEEAKNACTGEYLTDPEPNDDGDVAYDMAVRDCVTAIDAIKLSEPS